MEKPDHYDVSGSRYTVEALAEEYDLSICNEADIPNARRIIWAVCTMEEQMPRLTLSPNRASGFYSFVFKNFNQYIDLKKFYQTFLSESRDPKLDCITDTLVNPQTGCLVIRWKMLASGSSGTTPKKINNRNGRKRIKTRKRNVREMNEVADFDHPPQRPPLQPLARGRGRGRRRRATTGGGGGGNAINPYRHQPSPSSYPPPPPRQQQQQQVDGYY